MIEVRDTTFRGGPDHAYLLRVGDFPCATAAFPLAVERGKATAVGFAGPRVEGVKPVTITAAADAEVAYAVPLWNKALPGWPVPVLVHDHPEGVEAEPNDAPEPANLIPVPGGVSARFAEKGDVDHFKFPARKGRKYAATVLTVEVGSPAEVYLRALDAGGAELARSVPAQLSTRVEFVAPADADVTLCCEPTNFQHGPSEVYHLGVAEVGPDFGVRVAFDRLDVPAGGVGLLPITGRTKSAGFDGTVEVEFRGADGLSGKLTIPAGADPQPAAPLYLPLRAKADLAAGVAVGSLKATAEVGGKKVTHAVVVPPAVVGDFARLPREWTTQVAVAVLPKLPFEATATLAASEAAPGATLRGTVRVQRSGGFDKPVSFAAVGLPAGATAKFDAVPANQLNGAFEVALPKALPPGTYTLLIRSSAAAEGGERSGVLEPLAFTVAKPK